MRKKFAQSVFAVLVAGMTGTSVHAAPDAAASFAAGPFSPRALERAVRECGACSRTVQAGQTSTSQSRQKDSILNGGFIGAAIGGVGGSALVVAASGGSDDFGGAMLLVSPWTALGGFAVGAAIDALR
jgi:hypothetical protein